MDRRQLLKSLVLSTGYVVATPTLIQMLAACESAQNRSWSPLFLSDSQVFVIEQLTDLIIPKTNTLGALDVNTPQFLDLILNDITTKEDQDVFMKGASIFDAKFKSIFKKDCLKGTKTDFSKILALYFKINKREEMEILELVNAPVAKEATNNTYFIYKYLFFIRRYTIFAYYNTKDIVENPLF